MAKTAYSKCVKCGTKVKWLQVNGRWQLKNNDDGQDHWDLCREITRKNESPEPVFIGRTGQHNVIKAFDGLPWE